MSKKLYLVRRDLENIHGPMTLEEFQVGFDRMKFGLQDEIAGHCSRWVFLENSKLLKKHYPDVFEYVYQNLKSWSHGVSNRIPEEPKEFNKKMIIKFFGIFSVILLIGGGWAYHKNWISFHIPQESAEFTVEQAITLLKEEKISVLAKKLKANLPSVVESVQNSAGIREPWMPVIRWYAFHGSGSVAGVSPEIIRGNVDAFVPGDCSEQAWKKQIQASLPQWSLLMKHEKDTADIWSRLLAWDPHWIMRRPQTGWIKPESYISACIYMALKSFFSVASEDEFMKQILLTYKEKSTFIIHSIKNRLAWQSWLVNGTARPILAFDRQNMDFLTQWSCLESADSMEKLFTCHEYYPHINQKVSYLDYRFIMNFIRLNLKEDTVEDKYLAMITDRMLEAPLLDSFTGFDYRAELAFLRQLVKEQGNVYKSLQRVRVEFPTVNLTRQYSL